MRVRCELGWGAGWDYVVCEQHRRWIEIAMARNEKNAFSALRQEGK
jgi:hypothetical protein